MFLDMIIIITFGNSTNYGDAHYATFTSLLSFHPLRSKYSLHISFPYNINSCYSNTVAHNELHLHKVTRSLVYIFNLYITRYRTGIHELYYYSSMALQVLKNLGHPTYYSPFCPINCLYSPFNSNIPKTSDSGGACCCQYACTSKYQNVTR
jgi:hypothetical protein